MAEHRTRRGPCRVMRHNPHNAVMHLGHSNGMVTLWTPSQKEAVVKQLCHRAPIEGGFWFFFVCVCMCVYVCVCVCGCVSVYVGVCAWLSHLLPCVMVVICTSCPPLRCSPGRRPHRQCDGHRQHRLLPQGTRMRHLCCAVLCCVVLCCAVLCCVVLCCAVLCCVVLFCAVLCCVVLCCVVLLCAARLTCAHSLSDLVDSFGTFASSVTSRFVLPWVLVCVWLPLPALLFFCSYCDMISCN